MDHSKIPEVPPLRNYSIGDVGAVHYNGEYYNKQDWIDTIEEDAIYPEGLCGHVHVWLTQGYVIEAFFTLFFSPAVEDEIEITFFEGEDLAKESLQKRNDEREAYLSARGEEIDAAFEAIDDDPDDYDDDDDDSPVDLEDL